MATPTIRESLSAAASSANATVTTGAGTQVNDVIVAFFGNDYYTAAGMGSPTGTAGSWTLQATGDNGNLSAHVKVFTRTVTVGGAQIRDRLTGHGRRSLSRRHRSVGGGHQRAG
jgi:hypothetical protein